MLLEFAMQGAALSALYPGIPPSPHPECSLHPTSSVHPIVACFDLLYVIIMLMIQSKVIHFHGRIQTTGQPTIAPCNDGTIALSKDSCGVPLNFFPDLWQSGYGPILNNVVANRELGPKLMTWDSSLAKLDKLTKLYTNSTMFLSQNPSLSINCPLSYYIVSPIIVMPVHLSSVQWLVHDYSSKKCRLAKLAIKKDCDICTSTESNSENLFTEQRI